MSVEKLLEDTTTASMVQEADKVPEQEADDSSGVTNDSVGMNDGLLQTQNRYEAIGCDEEIAVASQARDWFKGLTSEERSGAVSFTDGAFLGTFLAFTAPWSTTTNAGANPRDVGKYQDLRDNCLRVPKCRSKLNRKIPE